MQSRRDQVHSYQFFMHRVISALVARESDPAEFPFRRLGGAALGSVMVAVLLLAGFGVYGLIDGGGASSWLDGNRVIVEKETAATYVYLDGKLHQVPNVTSARLVLTRYADTVRVSAKSLSTVARGPQLGLAGAPASLPDSSRLLSGPWSLCSTLRPDSAGTRRPASVLSVGRASSGGTALSEESAALVRDVENQSELFLIWNSHRFPLGGGSAALRALGQNREDALDVAGEWIDALPRGDNLAPIKVEGVGSPTTAFGATPPMGVVVGTVIESPANKFQLVRRERLTPLTALQKDVFLADPASVPANPDRKPTAVSTGYLAAVKSTDSVVRTDASAPESAPRVERLAPGAAAICATYQPGRFGPVITLGAQVDDESALATVGQSGGHRLADRVVIPPGTAALVEAVPAPDAPSGVLHIVTDQGLRFHLATPAVAGMLGYGGDRAIQLPTGLLDRLPGGPSLDPVTARQTLIPD
jgi:type VII secretion protein EccB